MDIKNTPEKYAATVGVPSFDVTPIRQSIELLLAGRVDYEFRTTVVAEYHTPEDIGEIARWLAGAPRYFLQPFVDSGNLIGSPDGQLHAPDDATMDEMLSCARVTISTTARRGA
jgi:pyruvate formate lyase activating enzyme